MTNVKDFLRYLRSVKSAMLIDTAGSLFVLLLGAVMYATQTYEPMLPIISLVGIQFIVSGYMIMSKIKNFLEELSKENITNFKGQTAKFTRYYTVKAIIFIIPLLTFFALKNWFGYKSSMLFYRNGHILGSYAYELVSAYTNKGFYHLTL